VPSIATAVVDEPERIKIETKLRHKRKVWPESDVGVEAEGHLRPDGRERSGRLSVAGLMGDERA